jgi:zinc transporter ZupT
VGVSFSENLSLGLFITTAIAIHNIPEELRFAAGTIIWMAFAELIPDANEDAKPTTLAGVVTISVVLMLILQILI